MAKYVNWVDKAQDAESRGDWAEAKRCWHYAAQQTSDGNMRAFYNDCEDMAEENLRATKQ